MDGRSGVEGMTKANEHPLHNGNEADSQPYTQLCMEGPCGY